MLIVYPSWEYKACPNSPGLAQSEVDDICGKMWPKYCSAILIIYILDHTVGRDPLLVGDPLLKLACGRRWDGNMFGYSWNLFHSHQAEAKLHNNIVCGSSTQAKYYPWQVMVKYPNHNAWCSGVLIDEIHVLATAHGFMVSRYAASFLHAFERVVIFL